MVRWGRFDTLAHLTYPFRYLPNTQQQVNYDRGWKLLMKFSRDGGKGIALKSTLGVSPCSKTMPDAELISRLNSLGAACYDRLRCAQGCDVGKYVEDGIKAAKSAGLNILPFSKTEKQKCCRLTNFKRFKWLYTLETFGK